MNHFDVTVEVKELTDEDWNSPDFGVKFKKTATALDTNGNQYEIGFKMRRVYVSRCENRIYWQDTKKDASRDNPTNCIRVIACA